jgi:ectoine hydroxylase-related dioxygenase (phytanoyl-CoA dioxygenase family)
MITEDNINRYREEGYLIIDNLFNQEELNNYLYEIKKIADKDFSAILNPDRFIYLVAQSFDYFTKEENLINKIIALELFEKINQMTVQLIKNNKVIKILKEIQQSEISFLMSQMLFKEAFTFYASQAWSPHQDNSYIDSDTPEHPNGFNTQYITTNIYFNESESENGGLYLYPGTHKLGKIPCTYHTSYREGKNSPGNKVDEKFLTGYDKVSCNFRKGSLIIMNGNLVHGSYSNNSSISRPVLSLSYITRGSYFYPGKNARRQEMFI